VLKLQDNKVILKCLVKSTVMHSKLFHTAACLSLKKCFEHLVSSNLKTVCNHDHGCATTSQ